MSQDTWKAAPSPFLVNEQARVSTLGICWVDKAGLVSPCGDEVQDKTACASAGRDMALLKSHWVAAAEPLSRQQDLLQGTGQCCWVRWASAGGCQCRLEDSLVELMQACNALEAF